MKVVLVSMPFGALERQALGLSILKPCLQRAGTDCDIRYLNFDFAALVGVHDYFWVTCQLPYTAFAGDWCFSGQLYGSDPKREQHYIDRLLRTEWQLSDLDVRRLDRVRSLTGVFLRHCLASLDWNRYDVVGFTSTFEQNIASLALARLIKQRYPQIRVVFGGANWEGEMGLELHRRFAFVDFVCSGEAELSLTALVECIGREVEPSDVPGIVYRRDGVSVMTNAGRLVENLDDLPMPEYEDYFRDLSASGVNADVLPLILFETARGCWWGAKSHCTFCGLNGGAMAFRAKRPARALAELKALTARWRNTMVESVDNILDMRYFHDFLPSVATELPGLQLFYEVKANLLRRHVKLLAAAGVNRIQPGIESMNDHVLALMRKGTTGLQNIQLLKWCREYDVSAEWNLLYGFPGETREDYREMLQLLPEIRFLGPPSACGPLRLDRFSPYFETPEEFGLCNLRPLASYQYLYPFGADSLRRIAYYFDFDYISDRDPRGFSDCVIGYVREWQKKGGEPGLLTATRRPDGQLLLADTRPSATASSFVLGGPEQAAYEYCDRVHSVRSIQSHLHTKFPTTCVEIPRLRAFLDSAVANHLMIGHGEKYLSMALATGELREALEFAECGAHRSLPLREVVA